jgi:hypothetical protein
MIRTRTFIVAAAAAVCSVILVAASASFRNARHESPQTSAQNTQDHFSKDDFTENDFATRWTSRGKGDRLPLSGSLPLAAAAPVAPTPVEPKPEPQPQLATEDDLRQADEEHHRHRDICPRGRTWFTMNNHRYWRCKL